MRLLILWTGIAAFVWIAMHPPTIWRRGVDTIHLLRDWAVVIVLTGGLLWTEAQVRPWLRARLYPWVRTQFCPWVHVKRWAILGVILGMLMVGGLLTCLVTVMPEMWNTRVPDKRFASFRGAGVEAWQRENTARITPEQARAELQRRAALRKPQLQDVEQEMSIRAQINTFFSADEMKSYEDFYGKTAGQYDDWTQLTPGQRANRMAVCERAQLILNGAPMTGMQISVREALERAHLEVAPPMAEQIRRATIPGVKEPLDNRS